jgi:hypothetical protein
MNGSDHQEEKDRRPMHLCPSACESRWYERAIGTLAI